MTQQDAGISAEAAVPRRENLGWGRWMWRQLTSMRTALILLFLLALASIPGSVLPQRGTNPVRVTAWITDHPGVGPTLDRLGFFDVYASPWFAAVYLLLFLSLIGCVLPRIRAHWRAMRKPPPPAPRHLDRMPVHEQVRSSLGQQETLADAAQYLRSHRWRVRVSEEDGWVSAEKGYLRETGNLLFHLALMVVLVAVAIGGLFGWKGNVLVREGSGFANTLTQYDAWGGGRFVDPAALAPFAFTLDAFTVDFERSDAQRGAPRQFRADVTYRPRPTDEPVATTIEVNQPLEVDGAKVFLVGHGYAPHFVVTDSSGAVVFDDSVIFLPQDANFTSTGVVKIPDAAPSIGINGMFLPTAARDGSGAGVSVFPAPDNPEVFLAAFRGDLGMDTGVPQSVYRLDTSRMQKIGLKALSPGQTWVLPGGNGTVEFAGFERWASFQIAYDPGKELALLAAAVAIAGLMLSLFVRRRRVWVKVRRAAGEGTLIGVAGLARNEGADVTDEVTSLAGHLGRREDESAEEGLA